MLRPMRHSSNRTSDGNIACIQVIPEGATVVGAGVVGAGVVGAAVVGAAVSAVMHKI